MRSDLIFKAILLKITVRIALGSKKLDVEMDIILGPFINNFTFFTPHLVIS